MGSCEAPNLPGCEGYGSAPLTTGTKSELILGERM